MKKLTILFSVLTLLFITGCSKDKDVKTMESGLQYVDENTGEGRKAKLNDLVSIHFKGWIVHDSTELFSDWTIDTTRFPYMIGDSYLRGQVVKFVLGDDAFIKGTDEGITGMSAGGKRTMIIPSELAYGQQGMGPIPPNTDLKIFVELLEIKDRIIANMWEVDTNKIKTTESGLKYLIVKEGEGEYAAAGNVVTVNYSGFLADGTKFDSSVERDEPFEFVVGNKQVIPGWDEGIRLMKKGSKARLILPPALAYGDVAVGKIPANSILIFDVELLDVK